MEHHLKARFNRTSRLCLGSDANENIKTSTKHLAIIYIFYELIINQKDLESLRHCTMSKFCGEMEVLLKFLEDIYNITIPDHIIEYVKQYRNFMTFRRFYNTTDTDEWQRIIISMNNGYYRIEKTDLVASVCKLSDIVITNKEYATVNLEDKTIDIENDEKIITSAVVTIPLDSESICDINKLLKYIPNYIKVMGKDNLIKYTLILMGGSSVYYQDEKINEPFINKGIKKLNCDPRINNNDWLLCYEIYPIMLNTATLRPVYGNHNNIWIDQIEKKIGNSKFISYYQLLYQFILEFDKIPNLEEYIIYIYKRIVAKPKQLYAESGYVKSEEIAITKLEVYTVEVCKAVLVNFNNLLNSIQPSIDMKEIKSRVSESICVNDRIDLEVNGINIPPLIYRP